MEELQVQCRITPGSNSGNTNSQDFKRQFILVIITASRSIPSRPSGMSVYRKSFFLPHFGVPAVHNKTSAILIDKCVIHTHKAALISRALSNSNFKDGFSRCCVLEAISSIMESGLWVVIFKRKTTIFAEHGCFQATITMPCRFITHFCHVTIVSLWKV